MICTKPFMAGAVPFGCGQCLPCRVNRRRIWSWRMFLESLTHERSSFVTLTYDQAHLPASGSLEPVVTQLWLKRFRKMISPTKVRYFLVGEYGDQTWRPHYHLCLFGVGLEASQLIQESWGKGFSSVYEFNEKTAQYCAGYVVKKLTSVQDCQLRDVHPEFARMSLKPGLGAEAMSVVSETLFSTAGVAEFQRTGDVPYQLKLGRQSIPLGRYLRRCLRDRVGMTDWWLQRLKDAFALERSEEVRVLLENAKAALTPRQAYLESVKGKIASLESRSKIYASRRSL